MDALNVIKSTKSEHWKDAFYCLFFTFLGLAIPIFGSAILLKIFSKPVIFKNWFTHGEFSIYSAGILIQTLYLITKDYKTNVLIFKEIFLGLTICGILFVVFCFAGILSNDLFPGVTINYEFIIKSNLTLFSLSSLIFYLSNVFENARTDPDVQKIQVSKYKSLAEKFDRLEK